MKQKVGGWRKKTNMPSAFGTSLCGAYVLELVHVPTTAPQKHASDTSNLDTLSVQCKQDQPRPHIMPCVAECNNVKMSPPRYSTHPLAPSPV